LINFRNSFNGALYRQFAIELPLKMSQHPKRFTTFYRKSSAEWASKNY